MMWHPLTVITDRGRASVHAVNTFGALAGVALGFLERAAALEPESARIRQALARAQLAELRGEAPSGAEEDLLADLLAP